jgi:Na+/melibiose symporter-like transporter
VGVGCCTSIFYICTIKEKKLSEEAIKYEEAYKGKKMETGEKSGGKKVSDWLCEGQFYLFGLVYMFARIAINCTATIFPFYLQYSMGFSSGSNGRPTSVMLALVPLSAYVSSMLFSLFLQAPMTQKFANRLKPLAISVVLIAGSSIPLLFLDAT